MHNISNANCAAGAARFFDDMRGGCGRENTLPITNRTRKPTTHLKIYTYISDYRPECAYRVVVTCVSEFFHKTN